MTRRTSLDLCNLLGGKLVHAGIPLPTRMKMSRAAEVAQ